MYSCDVTSLSHVSYYLKIGVTNLPYSVKGELSLRSVRYRGRQDPPSPWPTSGSEGRRAVNRADCLAAGKTTATASPGPSFWSPNSTIPGNGIKHTSTDNKQMLQFIKSRPNLGRKPNNLPKLTRNIKTINIVINGRSKNQWPCNTVKN